jgi:NAD(P)-dependent dehydrogenase (short-subunit alcohol dehydrogenase family)
VLDEEGRRTAAEIGATYVHCDVAEAAQIRAAVERAVELHGGLDVVFNNVGVVRYGTVEELPVEDWDATLAANLRAQFLACKYAIPHLRARGGGAIVNTASALAHGAQPTTAAYAASKAGVLGLTRSIAIDHAHEGIRCNSISPGTIDTPLVRVAAATFGDDVEPVIAEWGRAHPVGRVGTPEECARVVLFLASDEASFTTGSDYAVDGGLRAKLL